MKRFSMISAIAVLMVIAIATLTYAQAPYRDAPTSPTTTETLRQPAMENSLTGFIDFSRIQMSHSMGFGYASGGGNGYSQGYYMNTLSYQFNSPVMLRLRTGVTNNPYAASGSMTQPGQSALSTFFNNAEFFGGADLIWKPRDNMRIQISVDRLPATMYGYNNYYNPFGYGSPYSGYGQNSALGFNSRFYGPTGN
jgi:hypothetical protein